jgi:hypothetical protein
VITGIREIFRMFYLHVPMKKFIAFILILIIQRQAHSQHLSQVGFSGASNLAYFAFKTDQDVLIRVSDNGQLLEWGKEVFSLRGNFYHPSLQPFMGRIDYYGPEADSIFRGKIKSIGTCTITYYAAYETAEKAGKLRSIGYIILDYYSQYDDKLLRGKLKFLGNKLIEYYTSFGDESLRGKLKAIGNVEITYYSVFDDRINKGKLKSIGGVRYEWYSNFDRSDMRGSLKTGNYRQNIGGITYLLWTY